MGNAQKEKSRSGGNFWEGAAMGFVVSAANHAVHRAAQSVQKSKYFKNKGEAYDYMWENSFKDGKPYKEISGWELEDERHYTYNYKVKQLLLLCFL